MPPILSKPSSAAPTSLVYITIGALLTAWSAIWFFYNQSNPGKGFVGYMITGLLLTGIILLIIGFMIGPLSRAARQAELPPTEVTQPVVQAEQDAAATHRV